MNHKKNAHEAPLKAMLAQEVTRSDTVQAAYDRYNAWLSRNPEAVARTLGGALLRDEFLSLHEAAEGGTPLSRAILSSVWHVLDATDGGRSIGIGPGDGDRVWGVIHDDPHHRQAVRAYDSEKKALQAATVNLAGATEFARQLSDTDGYRPALDEIEQLEKEIELQTAVTKSSMRKRGFATLRVVALEQLDPYAREQVNAELLRQAAAEAFLAAD